MVRLLCILLLTIGLPSAATADTLTTYTITFTTATGSPTPVSGSFTYDSTNPGFTNFLVNWDSVTLDLTAAANAGPGPLLNPTVSTGCPGEGMTPAYTFAVMSQAFTSCGGTAVSYVWQGGAANDPTEESAQFLFILVGAGGLGGATDAILAEQLHQPLGTEPVAQASGRWSITATSTMVTPEPSTAVMLIGGLLAGIALRRKRFPEPTSVLGTGLIGSIGMMRRRFPK